jgi:serine/threonine protein kinase
MLSNCPNCGAITRLISKYCPECGHTLSRSTTPLESVKQSTVVPQNLAPGLILKERYRIVKPVGIGGAGVVYRGWDTILQIPCAIRVELESMDRESQEQFTRKISCLAQLSHPGLPHIWDHFSCPGQGLYQVMTYINGYNLQTVIDSTKKPLGEKIVLPWIIQICEVLEYIHAQEPALLHRNIKPRHIYITPVSYTHLTLPTTPYV